MKMTNLIRTIRERRGVSVLCCALLFFFAVPKTVSAQSLGWLFNMPSPEEILSGLVQAILGLIFWLFGLFAQATDYVIAQYVFNMREHIDSIASIFTTWAVLRDIANIAFIFILLYAGIMTILNLSNINTKQVLATLVVVALLVNFSFFLTGVVIDFSNMIALQFYNNIEYVSSDGSTLEPEEEGLGFAFAALLRAQSSQDLENIVEGSDNPVFSVLAVGIGASLLVGVAAFIFAVTAILFLIRYVVLVFLLIMSPIAFAARILPATKSYWNSWIKSLLNNAFFAPLFLGLTYVSLQVLAAGAPDADATLAEGLANPQDAIGTIARYIIVIIFMVIAVVVAKTSSAAGSSLVHRWGTNLKRQLQGAVVSGGVGAGAGLLRGTFGRGAYNSLQRNEGQLQAQAAAGSKFAKLQLKALRGAAGASFDPRNTKAGKNISGKGIKGYSKKVEDKEKAENKFAESLGEDKAVKEKIEKADNRIKAQEGEVKNAENRLQQVKQSGTKREIKSAEDALSHAQEELQKSKVERGGLKTRQQQYADHVERRSRTGIRGVINKPARMVNEYLTTVNMPDQLAIAEKGRKKHGEKRKKIEQKINITETQMNNEADENKKRSLMQRLEKLNERKSKHASLEQGFESSINEINTVLKNVRVYSGSLPDQAIAQKLRKEANKSAKDKRIERFQELAQKFEEGDEKAKEEASEIVKEELNDENDDE